MGIPIGKLALYCAAGGIAPHRVLPVVVDVGTNNVELREDPLYLGLKRPRLTGAAYYEVVDEFVTAVLHRWPKTLIQFEDFESSVAQPLLDRYRDKILCFNDDIQGTGATVLAGVLACLRQTGKTAQDLKDQRIVMCGAGSAGVGVSTVIKDAMIARRLEKRGGGRKILISTRSARLRRWCHAIGEGRLLAKQGMSPADYDALAPEQQILAESFRRPDGEARR